MLPIKTISAEDLDLYVGRNDAVLIDLREPEEYAKNHIRNAVNIPYEQLQDCRRYSRKKILVFYCERGSSSLFAAREFQKMGYKTKSVVGGIRCYQGSNLFFSTEHSRIKTNKK